MTAKELQERQKWSLDQKIDHALGTIDQFYQRLNGQVYISFSGGKDSTVLYWLARKQVKKFGTLKIDPIALEQNTH